MTVYIGVDFHPHQQTVCWCDPSTGEIQSKNLYHNSPELKQFYQQMPSAIIGIEASTQAPWYEALLHETGHELRVGNPALIRAKATSRHKSDKRDAELIFDLLRTNEFPTLWRRERDSSQVLEILKLRQSFARATHTTLQSVAGVGTRVRTPEKSHENVGDADRAKRLSGDGSTTNATNPVVHGTGKSQRTHHRTRRLVAATSAGECASPVAGNANRRWPPHGLSGRAWPRRRSRASQKSANRSPLLSAWSRWKNPVPVKSNSAALVKRAVGSCDICWDKPEILRCDTIRFSKVLVSASGKRNRKRS